MAVPEPQAWISAYARVQKIADREVLSVLQLAHRDVIRMTRALAEQNGIGAAVRRDQLLVIQRNLLREQAVIFRRLGDIVAARRLDAAARAVQLGSAIDSALLDAAGRTGQASALRTMSLRGLEETINTALVRMAQSAIPLAERIYRTEVWMNGRLDRMINSALSRGLSAREFGKEAMDWFSPNTPGGIRYASMRLARSEINNAFHAVSINQAAEKPWIDKMKWHLSSSHPKADVCDQYAHGGTKGGGVYPPKDVPRKPHPHCFCYVTPVSPSEDEFLDGLVSGKYDRYLNDKLGRTESGRSAAPRSVSKPSAPRSAPKPSAPKPPARSTAARPSAAKPPAGDVARAQQHLSRITSGLKDKELSRTIKAMNEQAEFAPRSMMDLGRVHKMSANESRDFEARWGREALGGYRDRSLDIHPSTLKPGAERAFQKDLNSGWFSKCGHDHDSYDSFLAHETGHHIDYMMQRMGLRDTKQVWDVVGKEMGVKPPSFFDSKSLDQWVKRNADLLKREVSGYGSTAGGELLAEIWAEYTTNPNARPKIKAIGKAMQELAERNAR